MSEKKFKKISIVGLGYIGLPTAAVFASQNIEVIGVDISQHVVDTINRGEIHIVEPDLDRVVKTAVSKGFLRAKVKPESADAFLIAVPTPFKDGSSGPNQPDLDYIESAAKNIAPVLKKGDLVVLESTSPVGATELMAAWLAEARSDLSFPQSHGESSDIRIAHCPERVLPGQVLRELVDNDRVIGGMTLKCSEVATSLYKIIVKGECIITNARTAEMCKLTENSFRDVNIAFANELSIICEKLKINVWELINIANRHPRVNILKPGPGVGGHCIAVDPWFIVSAVPEQAKLIHTARKVNDMKPEWIIQNVEILIEKYINASPNKRKEDVTVACLGLAFKPNIDDLRESPSLAIAHRLMYHGWNIIAVEPNIRNEKISIGSEELKIVDLNDALRTADIIVVLVSHREFEEVKLNIKGHPYVFDACGCLA